MVDAGHDQVGLAVKNLERPQIDAVGRCAVDGEPARRDLPDPQGTVQGQRVRGGAALAVGGHDGDLTERRQALGEPRQPLRVDTVVVDSEDRSHEAKKCPGGRAHPGD
jgi:hypothetical protein